MNADYPRDMVGYGRDAPNPRWPGGARIAIQIAVNYEAGAESNVLHGDRASEGALTDTPFPPLVGERNALVESAYEYGSRVGIWRLLDMVEQRRIKVSLFAVVQALERNPDVAVAFAQAGHEIVSHGYRWIDYRETDEATERELMRRAVAGIERLTGERPVGWMTGRPSLRTRALVVEEGGFLYDRDALNDELPYWVQVEGRDHLVIPYSYETNDMRYGSATGGFVTGRDFADYLCDAFDQLYAEGANRPRLMPVGLARAHRRAPGPRARARPVPRPRPRARGRLVRDRARDRRALAPGVPPAMSATAIDGDRMLADLDALSAIGRSGRGVHRPAFTEDDVRAREWLAGRLADAGLEAEIDGVGNVLGRSPGSRAVLSGSHVDSVPFGGRLDGGLGVVAALEAARALGGGVDVVAFADEEGTFTGTLGSRAFCGELGAEERARLVSADGRRFGEALAATGWAGRRELQVDPARHLAYVELHIEQGPVLEAGPQRLGVVTGIVGIRRQRVTFTGRADHAGTTPTAHRADAGAAALRYGTAFLDLIGDAGGPDTVCNVGAIRFEPGAGNIVPARAELLVEYRDLDADRLAALDEAVAGLAAPIADRAGVGVEIAEIIHEDGLAMDARVIAALERGAELAGSPARRMPSGAGHDGMIVGRRIPAGMLFAPSIDGRSHSEAEDTDPRDLVLAATALTNGIAELLRG